MKLIMKIIRKAAKLSKGGWESDLALEDFDQIMKAINHFMSQIIPQDYYLYCVVYKKDIRGSELWVVTEGDTDKKALTIAQLNFKVGQKICSHFVPLWPCDRPF